MTHDWHWTFGDHCHISFPGGGEPISHPPHAFSTLEGSATMSDASGNLLFYTDGTLLYAPTGTPINTAGQALGGTSSSTHSAIVVPPAGGGSYYHVFGVADWDVSSQIGPITYSAFDVSGGAITMPSGPSDLLGFGPQRSSERLAAVSHEDCDKYWVVSLHMRNAAQGPADLFAMRIDSDNGPTSGNTFPQAYPFTAPDTGSAGFCMKFSPDGTLLALATATTIDILTFNRASGTFGTYGQVTGCDNGNRVYGIEFSPNGQFLYFSRLLTGDISRVAVAPGTTPLSAAAPIGKIADPGRAGYYVGALQLAPNGKIYGTKISQNTLLVITDPDNPSPAGAGFNDIAPNSLGGDLVLAGNADAGLPTFTRITNDCRSDRCARLAAEVDRQLAGTPKVNPLRPCDQGQPIEQPRCLPIDLPRIAPWTSVRWGDSPCDCIEGDDTEVMNLTVCNPYRNLTLSNLTIHQIVVVQANGAPVANLPDGTPSVQLVPIGPYCFDDLAPCACVTRQFVLRLRGAVPGPYRILLRGICFDACFHGDEQDCFTFDVCKD